MGNYCRSPTAEGVFRAIVQQRAPELPLHIDSAGTHDYHVGKAPDPRSVSAAQRRGFDLTPLRARQVEDEDFERFDYILAMDRANLRDLAAHIESPMFLAHIRAAIGSPVQQTNCHPFRHGRWLFVHNGMISGFKHLRRDLLLEIDAELFEGIAGSADSELLFYLALTNGLEADPIAAMERSIAIVERAAAAKGIDDPVQMTIGIADGERLWTIRYSSAHESRTLFVSEDVETVRRLHPENPRLQELAEDARLIVSEPLVDLPGAWHEIPESTALTITRDGFESRPFEPSA